MGWFVLFSLCSKSCLSISPSASPAGCGASSGLWLRQHRRALSNLALALPETTPDERERIARAMWENMGRVTAEALLVDRIIKDPDRIEIVGREALASHLRRPGANIGVTLHMGNWELAGWPCAACGGSPAGVYRPLANPYLDRFLREQRKHLYPAGLFGKGKAHGTGRRDQNPARVMIDFVRQGGHLGFVCDQVDRRRGLPVPFFAQQAKFTPVPAMIARHVGARIWMMRCLRIGKRSCFRIDVKELDVRRTTDQADDVRATTAAIFRQFEFWIREAPEQWMWWNTRWVGEERRLPSDQLAAAGSHVAEPPQGSAATHGADQLL